MIHFILQILVILIPFVGLGIALPADVYYHKLIVGQTINGSLSFLYGPESSAFCSLR